MAQPSGLASQHVATAWQALVTDNPTDNIFDEYSELKRLEEGKSFMRKSGGRSLIGSIEYLANSTVESISPYQPLNTDPVTDLTNSKGGSGSSTLAFDHIAFKALYTLFVAFYDLVVNSNIVTCFKLWQFFFSG